MQKITRLVLFAVICAAAAAPVASAQVIKVKGRGEIVYTGMRKSANDERAALVDARKNALDRHAAGQNAAFVQLYEQKKAEAYRRLDDVAPDYVVIDEQTDKTSKRYTVTIETSINVAVLQTIIGTPPSQQTGSFVTFVFVARELGALKSFDDRQVSVASADKQTDAGEKVDLAPDGSGASRSTNESAVVRVETGGSTERKADDRTYRTFTVTEVDAAVNSVLTTSGYETVNGTDAGLNIDAFKQDFAKGNDVGSATRQAAVAVCRENKIPLLATATLTVGLPSKDPVTGLTRVTVSVNAQVSDLRGQFPRTVASIAGVPYTGDGADGEIARLNALNEAATRSARELADQLILKKLR